MHSYSNWPRLMRRETAAAYCDMSPVQFDRQCPVPAKDQGWRGLRWDRAMLDAWIENLPNKERSPVETAPPAIDCSQQSERRPVPHTAAERRAASLARLENRGT